MLLTVCAHAVPQLRPNTTRDNAPLHSAAGSFTLH